MLIRGGMIVLMGSFLALVVGCNKPNPIYCDEDTTCLDPDRQFCDLLGEVGGLANTCLEDGPDAGLPLPDAGPPCSQPGAFLRCDGDVKVSCNNDGREVFETCSFGCVEELSQCNECEPSAITCESDHFVQCDSAGLILGEEDCPLGCHSDEIRCNRMVPSNGLGGYLELASDADDVDLTGVAAAWFNTETGEVRDGDGMDVLVPSFLVPASEDGAEVRVFVVTSLVAGDVEVGRSTGAPGPAISIVAATSITLNGRFFVRTDTGSVTTTACRGVFGGNTTLDGHDYGSGQGGSGYQTAGATGGAVDFAILGGAGGAAFPNPDLVPLRGGCGTGFAGGAVQLVAGSQIELAAGASISVNAGPAEDQQILGGSSGGAALLEAPLVVLGLDSAIAANGGGGMCVDARGGAGVLSTEPAPGGDCTDEAGVLKGDGGSGGARGVDPVPGETRTRNASADVYAGGGGGSAGYIRINTRTGTYTADSTAVISPEPTSAALVVE